MPESLDGAVREVVRTNPGSSAKVQRQVATRFARALDKTLLEFFKGPVAQEVLRRELRRELGRHLGFRPSGWRRAAAPQEAIDAGWSYKEQQLEAMLTSDEAAARIRMTREALNQKRKARRVLGLEGAKRGVRYPAWQFEEPVFAALPRILQTLRHLDPWGHYLFLTKPEPLLAAATPLDALRKGRESDVLRVAELLAAEATTR
jgi:hypothetical protein